jgi:hypothetical protein
VNLEKRVNSDKPSQSKRSILDFVKSGSKPKTSIDRDLEIRVFTNDRAIQEELRTILDMPFGLAKVEKFKAFAEHYDNIFTQNFIQTIERVRLFMKKPEVRNLMPKDMLPMIGDVNSADIMKILLLNMNELHKDGTFFPTNDMRLPWREVPKGDGKPKR